MISILTFLVVQLPPGDFATHYFQELLGEMTSGQLQMGDPAIEQQLREDYGFDKPVVV